MKSPRFEVKLSSSNQFYYFTLHAADGEILLFSTEFDTRQDCLNAIRAARVNVSVGVLFQPQDVPPRYRCILRSLHGNILACTDDYFTEKKRDQVVELVKQVAETAVVE